MRRAGDRDVAREIRKVLDDEPTYSSRRVYRAAAPDAADQPQARTAHHAGPRLAQPRLSGTPGWKAPAAADRIASPTASGRLSGDWGCGTQ